MADNWQAWGIPVIIIGILLLLFIILFFVRKWIRGPMYKGDTRMDDKTVVITGANTGIGKITAMDLSKRGAKVYILCRDITKGATAAEEIKTETGKEVSVVKCDLASLESVRNCAAEIKERENKIHVLINNAGVMMCPQWQTKDGFEMQFGTNHLGHFLLTYLLLDNIKAAAPSRIVTVSSLVHTGPMADIYFDDVNLKNNYDPLRAYAQSKLANVLFTKSLAKKLKDDKVTTYALHPGVIKTELYRHLGETYNSCLAGIIKIYREIFFKTLELGAQTNIFCAVDESIADESGFYYADCKKVRPSNKAMNEAYAEKLWKLSLEMVGIEEKTTVEDMTGDTKIEMIAETQKSEPEK